VTAYSSNPRAFADDLVFSRSSEVESGIIPATQLLSEDT
jgi:hypothetical protein